MSHSALAVTLQCANVRELIKAKLKREKLSKEIEKGKNIYICVVSYRKITGYMAVHNKY